MRACTCIVSLSSSPEISVQYEITGHHLLPSLVFILIMRNYRLPDDEICRIRHLNNPEMCASFGGFIRYAA